MPRIFYGLVRVEGDEETVATVWRPSFDADDMVKPDEQFVAAATEDDAYAVLRATRPEINNSYIGYVEKVRDYNTSQNVYTVFKYPYVRGHPSDETNRVVAEHGGAVVGAEQYQEVTKCSWYHDSNLASQRFTVKGNDYVLFRYDQKKAAARRKGRETKKHNRDAKYAVAAEKRRRENEVHERRRHAGELARNASVSVLQLTPLLGEVINLRRDYGISKPTLDPTGEFCTHEFGWPLQARRLYLKLRGGTLSAWRTIPEVVEFFRYLRENPQLLVEVEETKSKYAEPDAAHHAYVDQLLADLRTELKKVKAPPVLQPIKE